jgi:tRNA threonylcarbamoyladenosine biosynthesis protein TsaB
LALILNIETSTPVCSVCLLDGEKIIGINEITENANHASMLAVMIDEMMKGLGLKPGNLDAVAVSAGPGSYTGLRIGAAAAKGLCHVLSIPLIAIDSLQVLAFGMWNNHRIENALYCPSIDARRNEVYFAILEKEGFFVKGASTALIDESFLVDFIDRKLVIGGSGREIIRKVLPKAEHILIDEATLNSSRWLAPLALNKWNSNNFSPMSSFEPAYLKPAFVNPAGKLPW